VATAVAAATAVATAAVEQLFTAAAARRQRLFSALWAIGQQLRVLLYYTSIY
jgi:hypothetical protein